MQGQRFRELINIKQKIINENEKLDSEIESS